MSEAHWYVPPPDACSDCGEAATHDTHKRRCITVWSSGRPGWGWCQLEADHPPPCQPQWWDGTVTLSWFDGEAYREQVIEEADTTFPLS